MKRLTPNGVRRKPAQASCGAAAAITRRSVAGQVHGQRPVETGANADKQRANSKDEDPTGLLNEGFRYRDIETGVWLSRDPAGFVDGPNLYAYVRQNPWTSFDPLGLESFMMPPQYAQSAEFRQGFNQGAADAARIAGPVVIGTAAVVLAPEVAVPIATRWLTRLMTPAGIAVTTDVAITTAETVMGIEGPGPVVTPLDAAKVPLQKLGKELMNEAGGKTAQQLLKQTDQFVEQLFHRLGDTSDTIKGTSG